MSARDQKVHKVYLFTDYAHYHSLRITADIRHHSTPYKLLKQLSYVHKTLGVVGWCNLENER